MTQPIMTRALPFPDSLIGLHCDYFLRQVGVHTAPHPLLLRQQKYVSGDTFEDMKPLMLSGVKDGQTLVDRARQLFFSVERIINSSQLNEQTVKVIAGTLAHQAALTAYLGVGTNHKMYRLYAKVHEYFAYVSTSESERRDHLYRAVWGYAHYAQRFQDQNEDAIVPWTALTGAILEARGVAHPDHAEALAAYLEIAKAGPPSEPLNLEELLQAIGGRGETFRGLFMTELKRFLDTKGKEFPPDQQLRFTPLTVSGGGSRIFATRLSIKDASGGHQEYPISIQVTHLSGFKAEDGGEMGTTVVSIRESSKPFMS